MKLFFVDNKNIYLLDFLVWITGALFLGFIASFGALAALKHSGLPPKSNLGFLIIGTAGLLIGGAGIHLFGRAAEFLFEHAKLRGRDFILPKWRIQSIISASQAPTHLIKPTKILIIRGPADEATSVLLVAYLISMILSRITGILSKLSIFALFFFLVVLAFVPHILYNAAVWVTIASAIPFLLLVGANAAKGLFGTELFLGSVFYDVSVDSTPDFHGDVSVLSLGMEEGGLRHFIHQRANCRRAIATWIRASILNQDWDDRCYQQELNSPFLLIGG